MPTYEYLCQTCSHRFETWQKMTDEPLTVCPECGSHIRRVLFASGVIFKGSGFYKTDHAKNSTLTAANGEGHNHKAESTTGEASKTGESKASETATKPTSGDSKATSAAAS